MSTKINKRTDKKPPLMETIITRYKAAQLKWQLRNKDASRKKISQMTLLLRSPKSQVKSPKKKPILKKEGRKSVCEAKEYYPDKLKRNLEAKKVILKPKHELKVIAVGSKRKGIPLKGIKSPPHKRSKANCSPKSQSVIKPKKLTNEIQNQMSIEEMVRLSDNEILNDEDLLEILTCESPVWWEDPPDEGYCEEPIYSHASTNPTNEENNRENISISKSIEKTEEIEIPKTKRTDEKFMKKRIKLENLLGNIKTKLETPRNNHKKNCNKSNNNLNELNALSMENNMSSCNKTDNIETKDVHHLSAKEMQQKNKTKEKRLSESTEGDDPFTNLRDDDILRDLENMNIPIEPDDSAKSSDDCIIIDKPDPTKNNLDSQKETDLDPKIENKMKIRREYLNILKKKNVFIDNIENVDEPIEIKEPDLPKFTITSIEKDAFSSPTSQSISEDTLDTISTVSQDNIDSISDANIHFIEEDTNCKLNEKPERDGKDINTTMNCTSNKLSDNKIKSNLKLNGILQKDCLTVYKIITKDDIDLNVIQKNSKINEEKIKDLFDKSETDGKLNSFYKKCKITYQRKSNTKKPIINAAASSDTKESDKQKAETIREIKQETKEEIKFCEKCDTKKKSIIVPNSDSVKYCFKCSSIFDTENCAYCVRKAMMYTENNSHGKSKCSCDSVEKQNVPGDLKHVES